MTALTEYCNNNPGDIEAHLRLADAQLIGWAGGAKALGRIVQSFHS